MSGEQPSKLQQEARKKQSQADRHQANKQEACALQSEADRAAVPKHGL